MIRGKKMRNGPRRKAHGKAEEANRRGDAKRAAQFFCAAFQKSDTIFSCRTNVTPAFSARI